MTEANWYNRRIARSKQPHNEYTRHVAFGNSLQTGPPSFVRSSSFFANDKSTADEDEKLRIWLKDIDAYRITYTHFKSALNSREVRHCILPQWLVMCRARLGLKARALMAKVVGSEQPPATIHRMLDYISRVYSSSTVLSSISTFYHLFVFCSWSLLSVSS